jgi:hypothetical protein
MVIILPLAEGRLQIKKEINDLIPVKDNFDVTISYRKSYSNSCT